MIELVGELSTASSLLHIALDRYLDACSAVQSYYTQTTTLTGVPRTLSECVSRELISVTSYEKIIKQAKSVISQARNCSADIPIHALPVEILTRIFYLVAGGVNQERNRTDQETSLPRYPDFLSHVCSRWRQIVLCLPELWSRVDLLYHHTLSQGFVARAEACASRAGDSLLDIRLRIPASYSDIHDAGLYRFLESTATRARSLELTLPSTLNQFPEPLVESCFESCTPGTLVEFAIVSHGQYAPSFVVAYEGPGSDEDEDDSDIDIEGLVLCLRENCFEDLLLPVTNLRLHGIYPPWASQAYHGLVELHLTSEKQFDITELELYDILESSPKLQILQFGLFIERFGLGLVPVCLEDLEVLNLGALNYDQLGAFLGLISIGSKPLQLTIKYDDAMSPRSKGEVTKFFMDSNITKLQLKGSFSKLRLEMVSGLFPQLRVLVLDHFRNRLKARSFNIRQSDTPPGSLPLETLYILNSCLDLDYVRRLAEKHPIPSIVFWKSEMFCNNEAIRVDVVGAELSKFCSVVKHVHFLDSNPVKGWV